MRTSMVAELCRAIAELIHDHPQAAEYTARKLGHVLEVETERARARELEDVERRRSTGERF